MQDLNKFKNEMNLSGQNVYVGHRYVPKIMGDWDNTQLYEPLSIVQYQGNSFTSRQYVPSGVEITNEDYWASTGNYNAQVEQYRQDVVNLGNDINNFNDDIIEITNGQNNNVKMLDSLGVYAVNFGVVPNDASVDNHDAIFKAIDYAVANDIGTIIFPAGEIYTSPINLEGYRYIKFKGQSPYNYSDFGTPITHNETSIRFISYAEYGIQTAGTNVGEWAAYGISFEDITLDGDKKVKHVVNARYNIVFSNFVARGGIECGIVLEPSTYPIKLINAHSNFNGSHGLWAKSPFSTVYSVINSEFSNNDGYGLLIEASAGSSFTNVTIQANKQGGIKVNSPDDTTFNHDYWLHALQFDNVYLEANGTLATTHAKYEGNYSVYITGVGKVIPNKISFLNTSLNHSTNGRTIKVDYGRDILFDLATTASRLIDINNDTTRVNNVRFTPVSFDWQIPAITYYGEGKGLNVLPTPFKSPNMRGYKLSGGAWEATRGRTTVYEFFKADIGKLESPVPMETQSGSGVEYHAHDEGSIVGLHFTAKDRTTINGTFNIEVQKKNINLGTWETVKDDDGNLLKYQWKTGPQADILKRYNYNQYKLASSDAFRVVIDSAGHTTRVDNNLTVTLLVEC